MTDRGCNGHPEVFRIITERPENEVLVGAVILEKKQMG
jgi:hypothetical protein